ncbi:DUF2075 domain-containing protein [Nocardia yamanashiensis]|uniref:DNA/RNA helicase domain-containing protein n=1 Tax=Nocardia yamanashiensis TaxID=209247 RepID=UPI001E37A4D8|nr:DNA/RNA helicase domain-containing protein [Nocardia yamanashiensis]UGT40907.1 DUF2075 domain-containing protein [Nocardia yamanashiensis]
MALVRGSARDLLELATEGSLPRQLSDEAMSRWQQQIGSAEFRSWQKSLPAFLRNVVDAGLGDVEVLLEHRLPHSPKRVDAILCGLHPHTGVPTYVLVELKQWSRAELAAREMVGPEVVSVPGYEDLVLNPIEQVRWYCTYLVDFTPELAALRDSVHGMAYLHNASSGDIPALKRSGQDQFGLMFTADNTDEMIEYLDSLLDVDSGREPARSVADEFLAFEQAPSKQLLQLAADEIFEREQFVMLDEQRVAYQLVSNAVARARRSHRARQQGEADSLAKTVIIVLGGPGSGKSVLALSILGELTRQNVRVNHATGSRAFTKTLRSLVSRRSEELFKYFNNFEQSQPGSLSVLICDEAHRIRRASAGIRIDGVVRWRRQIEQLIDVATVPIFLLDENQTVRPEESGSRAEIERAALDAGCRVDVVHLDGQFRCGGSDLFELWVERLLGMTETPVSWCDLKGDSDDGFQVSSAPTPQALEDWVNVDRGGTARMSAGYCWHWSDDPVKVDGELRLVDDVRIGDWRRPWNARPNKGVPDTPDADYWATDERGIGQVGCIFTAQGFEYAWAGVIFGPDFVRRGECWVARREFSHDPAVEKADDRAFATLIRNTYKVLLTRGMRGVSLYSTDPETQAFLEAMAR